MHTMHWLLIAALGPLLYALANHLDKLIISRFLPDEEHDGYAPALFSSIFGLLALPFIVVFNPQVVFIDPWVATALACNGMLVVGVLFCYFTALRHDEASYVVPFYQTIPLFAFALGYVFLGETITRAQAAGGLVVLLGAMMLSFEPGMRMSFKWNVVVPMLAASFLYSLNDVFFKFFGLETGFWAAAFWGYVGAALLGVFLFVVWGKLRREFIAFVIHARARGIGAASSSELLYLVGEGTMNYALLLAPIALVTLANALQPLFVFLLGILITLFVPGFVAESMSTRVLWHKGVAILFLVIGTYLIGA